MTTMVLNGTYSAGYALQSPVSTLSLSASGYVEGAGIHTSGAAFAAYTIVNDGRVVSGAMSNGIYLARGGVIANGGSLDTAAIIQGYTAVQIFSAPGIVDNYATITGAGAHGSGVQLAAGGVVTNGSASDTSAQIEGLFGVYANSAPTMVYNFGVIKGVVGGYYGTGVGLFAGGTVVNGSSTVTQSEIIGYGGVQITNGMGSVINYGTIATQGGGGEPVAGSFGVSLGSSASLTNGSAKDTSALVTGGLYGVLAQGSSDTITNFGTIKSTESLRKGVLLNNGADLTNGSATDSIALVEGYQGVVVLTGSATVTNFGTILGQGSYAVRFTNAGDVLIAETGSSFIGLVQGGGGVLELAGQSGTIAGLGSSGTLTGSVSMNFTDFGVYNLQAGTSWVCVGTNTLNAGETLTTGGTLEIEDTLVSAGSLNIDARLIGRGVLILTGGLTVINAGGFIGLAGWTISGGLTKLNRSMDYKGAFSESAGAMLSLSTKDTLMLSGSAALNGTVTGAGTVNVSTATLGQVLLGGGAALQALGAVSQSGNVTIGDGGTSSSTLRVLKSAVWRMGSYNLNIGAASANMLVVFGTLIKDSGPGISTIAVTARVNGTIEVAAGGLDLARPLSGSGTLKVDAGARLEIDSIASSGLATNFNGGAATLALARPKTFTSRISGFAPRDTIELVRIRATGASINASDQLVIVNGATTVATLSLSGNYAAATFSVGADGKGGTNITLLTNATAPQTQLSFIAAMASFPGAGGGQAMAPSLAIEAQSPRLMSPRGPAH